MEKYICTDCGYQGRPTKIGKIKIIKELLIWFLFRVVDVFYFLWKTCPRYNTCPKCKNNSMLEIFYMEFPTYYSLYARIYTLAFLSLQRTSIQDTETQKLILKEITILFKFIGNPIDLVLHEIESFCKLTNQVLILSESEDFEVVSLAIGVLDRLNIPTNKQKEDIDKKIADYISSIKKTKEDQEKIIIKTLGAKRIIQLCNNQVAKNALLERTKASPNLYIMLNAPINFFNTHELQKIFQSLVLANRAGLIKLIKHFNYKLPIKLKEYTCFLMICSLYYDLPNYKRTEVWLGIIEKLGIPESHISELQVSLKNIYYTQGTEYKKMIEKFIQRNKKYIRLSSQQFLKKNKI